MLRRPPRSTRTYPVCPDTTLFRAPAAGAVDVERTAAAGAQRRTRRGAAGAARHRTADTPGAGRAGALPHRLPGGRMAGADHRGAFRADRTLGVRGRWRGHGGDGADPAGDDGQGEVQAARTRSEEHTSVLQSLMRNSYAVFCLKNNI